MSDYGTEGLLRRRQEREQAMRDRIQALEAERDDLEKRRTEGPWECVFCLDLFDGGEEHWRRCWMHPANAEIAVLREWQRRAVPLLERDLQTHQTLIEGMNPSGPAYVEAVERLGVMRGLLAEAGGQARWTATMA
jgi:hypothetical protein